MKDVATVMSGRLRKYRNLKGLKVKQLSDLCIEKVPTLTESVITNIERPPDKRRASRPVTVEEVMALAAALEVPPLLLILPLGEEDEVQIYGSPMETWTAAQWWMGEVDLAGGELTEDPVAAPLVLFRHHAEALGTIRGILLWVSVIEHSEMGHGPQASSALPSISFLDPYPWPIEYRSAFDESAAVLQRVRAEMRRHGLRPPPLVAEIAGLDTPTPEQRAPRLGKPSMRREQ
jgi:transcriptional regulator with XRE-family HTH domain